MDGNIKEIVLLALEPIYPSKPITLSNPNRKLMKKDNEYSFGELYIDKTS